jgi:hypothetical protein
VGDRVGEVRPVLAGLVVLVLEQALRQQVLLKVLVTAREVGRREVADGFDVKPALRD